MQRVLVLEKDQRTAERIRAALTQKGDVTVSLVPTMREACLIVAQQPQDLAFVPFSDAEELRHSLRALQPDLKMVLTTADSQQKMSNDYKTTFQGILHTPDLKAELPQLLGGKPLDEPGIQPQRANGPAPPSLSRFKKACEETGLHEHSSPVQLAVLSYAGRIIGSCGEGPESYVLAVANLLRENWQRGQFSAQLQYLQLPDFYDARLVYSRSVSGVVLSLVAEPEVPIGEMRKLADRLARRLVNGKEGPAGPAPGYFAAIGRSNGSLSESGSTSSYAIAWRPVKTLPAMLEKIVQECIISLAMENNCRLTHLSVSPTIVHLVICCPAGRTAAWAVFLMKSGINKEIEERFGTRPSIWQKGFYATESTQPLSDAELKMMLT
jgi:hypothetical protein